MDETLRILVVDDDAVDRMAVRRALKATDLAVVLEEANDSAAVFAALERATFDCVFLDYRLPGTDGLAVVRAVRARGISTPIVMLTGQGDERLAVELMKAGASDYLKKDTLTPEQLAQSLRQALRVHRAETQATRTAENMRFLAEASRTLLASLDEPTICAALVRLPVPFMAAWCVVDLLDENGVLTRAAATPSEGDDGVLTEGFLRLVALDATAAHGPAAVLRLGQPLLTSAGLEPPVRALISVPLMVRERVLGVMSFAATHRPYNADDLAVAADLGQRAAIAVDNARLYRAAQDAVQLRDVFLSVASHELKTPLTSLFGNAQLLQRRTEREGSLSAREQRTLRVIIEQTTRLNKMITALLDISRIQSGQFSIEHHQVQLCQLVTRLAEELRPALAQHTLTVACPADELTITGDELRLEQVIQNLIQNAVKYSPGGGDIRLLVARHADQACVAVADNGIGIPAASIPHLFNRFYRASNVHEQHISGIGVGLFVVREIMALHGGTVNVASVEGQGSTFTICLPLKAEDALVPTEQS